ncbi:Sorting nexin-8 [Durusdinium trenchii]|uniref:Sorting nexin-8 n=1 Tax=Durusdinium trenchii TaxID=1381693 RepID=A0ABP0JZ12_9DINO
MTFSFQVENPDLELDAWVRLSDEDPVLVSISEPHKESKGFMKSSVVYSIRTSSRAATSSAQRSFKDFVAFRQCLVHRFPGACIPAMAPSKTFKKSSEEFVNKRMHFLEFFLQAVAENPFFRSDDSYEEFVSSPQAFKRSLADEMEAVSTARSEGFMRWRQALTETRVQDSEKLRGLIVRELEQVRSQLKGLRKAATAQVDKWAAMSSASLDLYKAFAKYYVLERDSIQFITGTGQVPSDPIGTSHKTVTLSDVLLDASDKASQYAAVHKSDTYSAQRLRAFLVDPVVFELDMVKMWLESMDTIQGKFRQSGKCNYAVGSLEDDLESLGAKVEAAQKKLSGFVDDKSAAKLKKQMAAWKRQIDTIKSKTLPSAMVAAEGAALEALQFERGILGFELNRYRASRTIRMDKMMSNLTRFHLHALEELSKAFDGTGSEVRLGRDTKGRIIVTKNTPGAVGSVGFADDASFVSDGDNSSVRTDMLDQAARGRAQEGLHQRKAGKFSLARFKGKRKGHKHVKDPEGMLSAVIGEDNMQRSNQMRTAANMRDGVTLRVKYDHAATKSDELDVSEGEILTAKRVDDNLWYATNSRGQAGLVPLACVDVKSSTKTAETKQQVLRPKSYRPKEAPPPKAPPSRPAVPPGLDLDQISAADNRARGFMGRDIGDPADSDADSQDEETDESDDGGDDDDEEDNMGSQGEDRRASLARQLASSVAAAASAGARRASGKKTTSQSVSKLTSQADEAPRAAPAKKPPAARPAGAPPMDLLSGIKGFDKKKLDDSKKEKPVSSNYVPPARTTPTSPMEELRLKLAMRERIE